MTRIGIILGSTRPNRNGEQVATWVYDMASRRSDAEFELIDLRHYLLPPTASPAAPGQPSTCGWSAGNCRWPTCASKSRCRC